MTGEWFSTPAFERLAGSLLHFVWQGALIALLAALALHLLKRRSAQVRYVAACVSLLLMLLAPIVTVVFYAETGTLAQRWLQSFHAAASVGASTATSEGVALWTGRIVLLWAAGVALCLMRLLGGWLLSRRLVHSATAVMTPSVLAVLQRARTALAFHQSVRLLAGARIDTPMVVGWLRPAILLPASALTGLSATHLLAILAHELAHVRRHDFLINAIQRMVECVLFYHPAVWWISGRIRVERERCCDDLAVAVCGDRLVYAQALMALEDVRSREPVLALAAAGGGLTDRVRRILGAGSRGVDWQSSVAVGLCVALLGAAGLWHPVSAEPAAASPTKAEPTRARQVEAEPRAAKGSSFDALAAILTAQGAPAAQTTPQPRPRLKDPATPVTQPTIAPARAAAREKLGQLRVDYSADSFVKQATEGDTIAVNLFLAAAMNINALDKEGYTALIGAARARQTETVQALIAAGADVNIGATPNSGVPGSALSFAARNGDLVTMQVLLSGGAQVNLKVGAAGVLTALTSAVDGGHLNAVELLVNRGADLEATSNGATSLVLAACQRRNEILRLLLERGANARAATTTRSGPGTALHCAVTSGNLDGVQLLLDKGAEINAIASGNGRTPLVEALERGRNGLQLPPIGTTEKQATEAVAVARLLIDRGADVNLADGNGRTPLMAAVPVKDVGLVRALLARGANPNVADSRGQTPLKAAAGSNEIERALIEAGAKN